MFATSSADFRSAMMAADRARGERYASAEYKTVE